MKTKIILKSIFISLIGTAILLFFYFTVLTSVSGWSFAKLQFFNFWYFIVSLAIGFGIQIGLYTYLKNAVHYKNAPGKVLAVSGTASTVAMISCCAHYLANILPILGAIGIITIISQYQIQLFWVGLISNLLGIIYISNKIIKFFKSL